MSVKRPASQQGARKPQQAPPPKPKRPSARPPKVPGFDDINTSEAEGRPVPGGPGPKKTYTPYKP